MNPVLDIEEFEEHGIDITQTADDEVLSVLYGGAEEYEVYETSNDKIMTVEFAFYPRNQVPNNQNRLDFPNFSFQVLIVNDRSFSKRFTCSMFLINY